MHGDQVIKQPATNPSPDTTASITAPRSSVRRPKSTAHQQHHETRHDDNDELNSGNIRTESSPSPALSSLSDTGNDFQKSMLRSFRSLCSESQTIKKLHDHRYHHDCRRYVFERRAQALHLSRGPQSPPAHLRRTNATVLIRKPNSATPAAAAGAI